MTKLEEKLLAQIRARLEGLDVRASDKLAALLPALRKLLPLPKKRRNSTLFLRTSDPTKSRSSKLFAKLRASALRMRRKRLKLWA